MSVIISYISGFNSLRTTSHVSKGFALHATPRVVEILRRSSEDIGTAVKMWCDPETRTDVEEEYGRISFWETSEVTSMGALFCPVYGVGDAGKEFNDDISRWNVDRVESMDYMFYGAESLNQDLSKRNIENCTNMNEMFLRAESFNQDLSLWNVEKRTNMTRMLNEAKKFNQDSIMNWDLSGKNTYSMFINHMTGEQTMQGHMKLMEERKKLAATGKFSNNILKAAVREWCEDSGKTGAKYGHISGWDMSEVTDMKKLFCADEDCVGEAAKQFNDDISKWNVDRVENMKGGFGRAE